MAKTIWSSRAEIASRHSQSSSSVTTLICHGSRPHGSASRRSPRHPVFSHVLRRVQNASRASAIEKTTSSLIGKMTSFFALEEGAANPNSVQISFSGTLVGHQKILSMSRHDEAVKYGSGCVQTDFDQRRAQASKASGATTPPCAHEAQRRVFAP